MDPNAALAELRGLVVQLTKPAHAVHLHGDEAERVVDLFYRLDCWISTGGFLPAAWAEGQADAVPQDAEPLFTEQEITRADTGWHRTPADRMSRDAVDEWLRGQVRTEALGTAYLARIDQAAPGMRSIDELAATLDGPDLLDGVIGPEIDDGDWYVMRHAVVDYADRKLRARWAAGEQERWATQYTVRTIVHCHFARTRTPVYERRACPCQCGLKL
jgi:hypothetical protein